MKLTQVNFGGAMALYIDGELAMMRKRIDYDDFIDFLLNCLHESFEPVETIIISDYSSFWEIETDFSSRNWTPDLKLENLMKKVDNEHDKVF